MKIFIPFYDSLTQTYISLLIFLYLSMATFMAFLIHSLSQPIGVVQTIVLVTDIKIRKVGGHSLDTANGFLYQ